MTNKYYDGLVISKIWNDIDWVGCCGAEDFYVNLQLLYITSIRKLEGT